MCRFSNNKLCRIYLQIDDRYLENEQFGEPVILPSSSDASLRFGSLDGITLPNGFESAIPSFLGCIGDVTYNEK